jgi:hypothetical protein
MSEYEKRVEPRQPVPIEALMSPLGAFGAKLITLQNVSANGAMGETADPPGVGEAVNLKVGSNTSIVAVVVWKLDNRFGLKFEREIDSAEFGEL